MQPIFWSNHESFESLPPRALPVLDLMLKILKMIKVASDSLIGFRCFLRDFVGLTTKNAIQNYVAGHLSRDEQSVNLIFKVVDILRTEKPKIVSIAYQPITFGSFLRGEAKSRRKMNDLASICVFPDLNLLQFALNLQNGRPEQLVAICWITQFCSFESVLQRSDDKMETDEDEDWLDEDDEEFISRPIVQELGENQRRVREDLFNYLLTRVRKRLMSSKFFKMAY